MKQQKKKKKGLCSVPACRNKLGCVNPTSSLSKGKYRDNFLLRQIPSCQFSWRTILATKHYSNLKTTCTADSCKKYQVCTFWSQRKHVPSFLLSPITVVPQQCRCHWLHGYQLPPWPRKAMHMCSATRTVKIQKLPFSQFHQHIQHSEKRILYDIPLASSIILTDYAFPFKLSPIVFVN